MKKQSKSLIESRGERIFNRSMIVIGIFISLITLYPIYYTFIASISKPLYVSNGVAA